MHTKRLFLLTVVTVGVVLAGCSSDGGDDARTVTLPGADQLESYTGTQPSNATEAQTTATAISGDLSSSIDTAQSQMSAAVAQAIQAAATQTETFSGTYNVPSPGSGSITISGTETVTTPDDQNATSGTFSYSTNYTANIDTVTLDADNNASYDTTIDGDSTENLGFTVTYQTNTDGSGSMTVRVTGEFGSALSVSSNESGVYSGKYILRVSMSGGGTITYDSDFNFSGSITDELSISGTLTVYDNDNQQIVQTTLNPEQVGIDNDFFSL